MCKNYPSTPLKPLKPTHIMIQTTMYTPICILCVQSKRKWIFFSTKRTSICCLWLLVIVTHLLSSQVLLNILLLLLLSFWNLLKQQHKNMKTKGVQAFSLKDSHWKVLHEIEFSLQEDKEKNISKKNKNFSKFILQIHYQHHKLKPRKKKKKKKKKKNIF